MAEPERVTTARSLCRRLRAPLSAACLLLLTACAANAPQDALKPEGPVARRLDNLFRPVFWIAAGIFFLVEGLIVFAMIRFRDRPGRQDPKQVHGNKRLEIAWTVAPALIMLGVAIPTVIAIFGVSAKEVPNDVKVKVVGHQWWWEYHYVGTDPEVVTANELVIPTGRTVTLLLESKDVIHSWWVPKLAGKQDAVPERVNPLQFTAEKEGTYLGQCAEFCSISHANMRLRVIAKSPAGFEAWIREQQAAPAEPSTPDATAGRQLFISNACISCHAIRGISSATTGPDLTHFASRATLGAALYSNTDDNLFLWIKHARIQKPGVLMPNFDRPLPADDPSLVGGTFRVLTDDEIRRLVAYLRGLR